MTTYSAHFERLKRAHGYLNIAMTMIEDENAWLKFPVASTATGVSATLQMHQALTFLALEHELQVRAVRCVTPSK